MIALILEFVLLFVAAPTAFAFTRHRIPAIPALWVLTSYCLFVLLNDMQFDRRKLWDVAAMRHSAVVVLGLFGVVAIAGVILMLRYAPELFLSFPKANPLLWGLVMILYPVLSVYPQGIIYRAFIFERYGPLFGSGWVMILMSALAFAYVHIVFKNGLAVVLTVGAGLLFAFRYWQTESLFVSSVEHALYGCAIFTVGLGRFFYHGAVQR